MSAVSSGQPLAVPVAMNESYRKANSAVNMDGALFDKYIVPAHTHLPEGVDFSGSIALTRDTKKVGWLHQLIALGQRIHAWFVGRKADNFFAHGLIITGHDNRDAYKLDRLMVAHSVFSGVRMASRNYLNEPENCVTELVIYVPRDPKLRQLLTIFGKQTAYSNPKHDKEARANQKLPKFSICDMFRTLCNNPKPETVKPSEKVMKRLAFLVADLLKGNQILDKKNNAKSYFCTPYAATVLQGSMLVNALSDEEKAKLAQPGVSRSEAAKFIYTRLHTKDRTDALSKTFWENNLFKHNARFVMSSYFSDALDKLSGRVVQMS